MSPNDEDNELQQQKEQWWSQQDQDEEWINEQNQELENGFIK